MQLLLKMQSMVHKSTFLVFSYLLILTNFGLSQENVKQSTKIEWIERGIFEKPWSQEELSIWDCETCQYDINHPETPFIKFKTKVQNYGSVVTQLTNVKSELVDIKDQRSKDKIKQDFTIETKIIQERNQYYLSVKIFPFKEANGEVYKIEEFDFQAQIKIEQLLTTRMPTTTISKLSDGDIYKIAIKESGVYEMDAQFLNELGVNSEEVDPRKIQILGNGGGKLNQGLGESRIDDLNELAIEVIGENDGSFDQTDKIRFYAEGADVWTEVNGDFVFNKNIYDETNYYFLKVSSENGKRINSISSNNSNEFVFDEYDYYLRYEEDKTNLLGAYGLTQGSGQDWYGDKFEITRTKEYSNFFSVPDLIPGEADFSLAFAARSGASSEATVSFDNIDYLLSFGTVQVEDVEKLFARRIVLNEKPVLSNTNPQIRINYPATSTTSEGWLDFIQLKAKRSLKMLGNQMEFFNLESKNYSNATLRLKNATNTKLWDISDLANVQSLNANDIGDTKEFSFETENKLKRFIAFSGFLQPEAIGPVDNQNIHGILETDYAIVYHPDLEEAAKKLADHRIENDGLVVDLVNINQLYNEFSSGRVDPTAIRNFAKMIYDRTDNFNYLLLFGDGTYDYQNKMPGVPEGNFVPTYQTKVTLNPVESFPSDDYYSLLSDTEGLNLSGALDIAVGRIPAKNSAEANTVVNKIIHYDTSPACLGDWRLNLLFNADDEDSNTHLFQANGIANSVEQKNPIFNQSKVYWDAYPQVSTPGGDRYPDATLALNKEVNSGTLLTNYLGHGGSKGWSQERVLKVTDIQSYDNLDRLTTFVTATCSFTGFDDPAINTAGEICLMNPQGAAVALLTTTRAVYVSGNKRLTEAVYDTIFTKVNGQYLRLGELMRRAKNSNPADISGTNARKFAMIGDPAMKLALPKYEIITTKINGVDANQSNQDTIGALQKVTIEGYIADFNGNLNSGFNGVIYPTVYDKKSTVETLSNDGNNQVKFEVYKNIIFKGAATVSGGMFSFSFIVPKDIDYAFGKGKISYYASDGNNEDAGGYYSNLVVGGTNENAIVDDQGPQIDLFMDNLNFAYGDATGRNTTLIAKLSDDNGINITGTSIGHDLTGVLDEKESQSFILNEFYEAEIDDYTSGTVEYPIQDLDLGIHQIRVKAWDIANNSAEAMTEFLVVDSEVSALENVLNYPNPFTTNTSFYFNTELKNTPLDVIVNIYTLSGKLVKTIQANTIATNGLVNDVQWNGNDDFESNLAKGVYLYKIKASSEQLNTSQESRFEKLVILK